MPQRARLGLAFSLAQSAATASAKSAPSPE
jgi:hypothetical protein